MDERLEENGMVEQQENAPQQAGAVQEVERLREIMNDQKKYGVFGAAEKISQFIANLVLGDEETHIPVTEP